MTDWEHKVVYAMDGGSHIDWGPPGFAEALKLGQRDGWELVCATPLADRHHALFFKRPARDDSR